MGSFMGNSKSTRRDFLKTSAGIAAAAPYIWTGSYARAQSANDRLNVAAIGVGGRGSGIGHQAGSLGNMVACADVHRGNAENFAKRYRGKCQIYEDYRKILDRKDVDAITCGTPDHWHVKIAIDAMKAGKDLYCEKPLTLTMKEGRQVCQVTKQTGRVFQVGTQQRSEFNKMFLKAVALARSGRLGKKLHAISSVGGATSGGPWPIQAPPPELNWDFWLGQAPRVPFCPNRIGWNFRWWLEYSGGQVTDWGVHHTDIALWALGGENTGPIEAEGKGDFPIFPADFDVIAFLDGQRKAPSNSYNVARTFDCNLILPNGNTINLVSKDNELIIQGEKGRIRVNRGSLTGKPIEEIAQSKTDAEWLDREVARLYRGMPIHNRSPHMANFFDCVKTRQKPISDVWTHCNSVAACHMANIAMLLRRKVKFDPEKYQFIGDEQANRLMSRKRREPYTIEL
jgi:myo-inositol 2-dehydrogenase/D-chiro-inositol 1-dehydrogenase